MDESIEYIEQPEAQPGEGFAQSVSGDKVHFSEGFALNINAKQDVQMSEGGALGIAAGRDMQMSYAGALGAVAGRDMHIVYGGAWYMVAGGNAEIVDGAAGVAVTGALTANNSRIGLVVGPTTLNEGSQVLLSGKQAALFGAALGAVFALLSLLLRRR